MIPPEADAEFVAHMEDVLDVYSRPYDADIPVLCMDEQPVQLVEEVKTPIEATKKHPRRVDYEYKRAGVANVFMFAEPLAGWRHVAVRDRKTKVDWAIEMANLLEGRYADCEKVLVVCDNLNTHTTGSLLRSLRTGACPLLGPPHRVPLHAQARQLAEHRRERTKQHDPPMRRGAPHRECRATSPGNHRLARGRQPNPTWSRMANENRRRPHQTEIRLP